jgi:hypothetical protein
MFRIALIIFLVSFLTNCTNSSDTAPAKDKKELVTEPAKEVNGKPQAEISACVFSNPDTSLSAIRLREAESAAKVISNKDKINMNDQYRYYSATYRETLTMNQHPGDGKYNISIFRVDYSKKEDYGYRKLAIDTFKTEKGIKLGISKKEIIEKLGSCYTVKDSVKGYMELYYRLEAPQDSQTKILENNNMPIYYASYKLWNDKLGSFEFGFEYP